MDSIGAAIGILKVAQANNKDGFIVIDPNQIGSSVQRLIGEIKKYEELWSRFITPEEAMEISNDDTLLVIVDTHKPSLVMEERLVNKIEHIVVIDITAEVRSLSEIRCSFIWTIRFFHSGIGDRAA